MDRDAFNINSFHPNLKNKILKSIDPDLNIIMITAFSDDVTWKDEITNPNLKTMQKPMDIDKLCGMLESIK